MGNEADGEFWIDSEGPAAEGRILRVSVSNKVQIGMKESTHIISPP